MRREPTIVFVTPSFPPAVSGAASHFSELAFLCAKKMSVVVLTVRQAGTHEIEKVHGYVVFRAIPNLIHSTFIYRILLLPMSTFLALIRLQKKYGVLFIHAHSSSAVTLGVNIYSMLTRTPLILDVQDLMTPRWLLSLGKVVHFIATGDTVKEKLIKARIPRDKITTVWSLPPSRMPFSQTSQRAPTHEPLFLFVGELRRKIKGLDTLLLAFSQVVKRVPGSRLVIVGSGPDERWCREYITREKLHDKVELKGWLPHWQTLETIARATALILPSRTEAIPRVIGEAFFYKKPVIASRVGGIPDIVRDGKNGILITPGSWQELTEAMTNLAENSNVAQQLGKTGKETLSFLPTWEKVSKKLLALYRNQ